MPVPGLTRVKLPAGVRAGDALNVHRGRVRFGPSLLL